MFCYNCGTKLIENAKFCIGCGIKLQNTEVVQAVSDKKNYVQKEFIVKGISIRFSNVACDRIKVQAVFEISANYIKSQYSNYYIQNIKNYDSAYSVAFETYMKYLLAQIEHGHKYLLEYGVDCYDSDYFREYFLQKYDLEYSLKDYILAREEVEKVIEQIISMRGLQRSSRSQWSGGGLGFSGAIKGAIQAGMLNIATNTIRSMGDSLTDLRDKEKINQMKEKIFHSKLPYKVLVNSLYDACCELGNVVYSILVKEGILEFHEWWSSQKLNGKMNNTMELYMEGKYDSKTAIKVFCECIENYPYHMHLYRNIYIIAKDTYEEIMDIADFIGCTENINTWMEIVDSQRSY